MDQFLFRNKQRFIQRRNGDLFPSGASMLHHLLSST
jgi:hypothetical protein